MTGLEYDVSDVSPLPPPVRTSRPEPAAPKAARHHEPLSDARFERYRLFTVEELTAFPRVDWLIPNYLAAREISVFFGRGDTYKSFVALDWACHLASRGAAVVYIASEGTTGTVARVAAWQAHQRATTPSPNLQFLPSTCRFHVPTDVENFVDAVRNQLQGTPKLVVVDTLARNFVGGSENDPRDLGLFVDGIETVRRALGTAVLVIHHATKDGRSERGTEALRNASFAVFKFERINQTAVRVTCDRMKEAERADTVTLRPQRYELSSLSADGVAVSSLAADWPHDPCDSRRGAPVAKHNTNAPLSRPERRTLAAVLDLKDEARIAAVARRLRIAPGTASRRLNDLGKRGLLRATGTTRDRRFALTEAAQEALR